MLLFSSIVVKVLNFLFNLVDQGLQKMIKAIKIIFGKFFLKKEGKKAGISKSM